MMRYLSLGLKKYTLIIFQLSIGFGTIFWLYKLLGSTEFSHLWSMINNQLFIFALALQIFSYIIGCYRWWLLLRAANIKITFFSTLAPYFTGLFCNQFLPTGIGGDGIRIFNLYKQGYSGSKVAAATVIDRIIGLIALIIIALVSSLIAIKYDNLELIILVGSFFLLSILLVLFNLSYFKFIQNLFTKLNAKFFLNIHNKIIDLSNVYKESIYTLMFSLFISFLLQILMISVFVILAHVLSLNIPSEVFFLTIPLVFLTAIIPLSLGGLGTREASLVILLGLYGISDSDSIKLAFTFLLLLLLSVSPGFFTLLFSWPKQKIILKR